MPVKDLVESLNDPPSDVLKTALGLPYRDFITVGLLVKKLNVENTTTIKTINNMVPDCWIYIQEPDVKIGRLQIFNNWSPYMVRDINNSVWLGLEYFCTEGDELWTMADNDFISMASDELEKIKIIGKSCVIDSFCFRVKKAYPAYFGSYNNFNIVKNYLDGIENLWCIGRNGQHKYNNMDHSMLTAMEAVKLLLGGGKNKETLWNINAEEDYHESK